MDDIDAIQRVIARFANSFDLKDWNGLEACLTESLYTDYSDLRGTAPQTLAAGEYVKMRRSALDHLKLHHLAGNHEIVVSDADTATCRSSMVVWRRSAEQDFTSHCVYEFQLTRQGSDWRISGITQKVLWNEGSPSIHTGAGKAGNGNETQ